MKGRRRPAHRRIPPATDLSAGNEAIALLRELDLTPDPWQEDIILAGMGRDRAGNWAADGVAEIVPRQNGKTPPLFARALWGIVHGGERKQIWSAHEFKTAREAFFDLRSLCEHPRLGDVYSHASVSHGKEALHFQDGQRILFVARSRTSGRGFGSDLVVLDEAFALTDAQMSALLPALSAHAHPQVWYASSAPLADSAVLRALCLAGRRGEDGLTYLEWCAGAEDAPDDVEAWAKANPALGRRLTERFTRTELARLGPESFLRERLGIWHEDEGQMVFPVGAWAACADRTARGRRSRARAVSVDVSPDRSRATVAAAGFVKDGRALIEVIRSDERSGWVPETVAGIIEAQGAIPVIIDSGGQAASLIPVLEAEGIEVTRTGPSEMVAACGSFFDRVTEGRLCHLEQSELSAAVTAAKQRDLGDGWAWHRRRSSADITPLVACTLALWGVEDADRNPPLVVSWLGSR